MSWKPKKLHIYELQIGQVGASWGKLGQVGNQRNYKILTLKKRLRKEERKKKNIGYRVASNERRLKILMAHVSYDSVMMCQD